MVMMVLTVEKSQLPLVVVVVVVFTPKREGLNAGVAGKGDAALRFAGDTAVGPPRPCFLSNREGLWSTAGGDAGFPGRRGGMGRIWVKTLTGQFYRTRRWMLFVCNGETYNFSRMALMDPRIGDEKQFCH